MTSYAVCEKLKKSRICVMSKYLVLFNTLQNVFLDVILYFASKKYHISFDA